MADATPKCPKSDLEPCDTSCPMDSNSALLRFSAPELELMEVDNYHSSTLLKNVFDTMAQDGKITIDQLPFLMVGAEFQGTPKELEEVIQQLMPDSDELDALLDFQQVELLFQQLQQNVAAQHQESTRIPDGPTRSVWRRVAQWWRARQQRKRLNRTAYEKHMRPTTRLLLVILCTSCAICIAIVVVAIVLIWNFSVDNVLSLMKRDVDLMREGMNLYAWQKPVELKKEDNRQLASLVSLLTRELGYKGSKETLNGNVKFHARVMAGVLDGWYEHDAVSRVSMNSRLVGGWLNITAAYWSLPSALAMLNALNYRLPTGHELVLSSVNSTSGAPVFLTDFRFQDQCAAPACGSDPRGAASTRAALRGETGTAFGVDYRPVPVVTGYTFLPNVSLGVVYKIDQSVLQAAFEGPASQLIDAGNDFSISTMVRTNSTSHEELVLAWAVGNKTRILSDVINCNALCLAQANVEGTAVALAARNQTGAAEMPDVVGDMSVVAYAALPRSGLGVAVSVKAKEFLMDLLPDFGAAMDAINDQFTDDTKELQFASFTNATTTKTSNASNTSSSPLTVYTTAKYGAGCVDPNCTTNATTCPYLTLAAAQCTAGNVVSQDYRGLSVFVGFACLADLDLVVTVKIDESQVKAEGLTLARAVAIHQNTVRFNTSSTEFLLAQKKPGVTVPQSARDFIRIAPLKHSADCPNGTCVGFAQHTLRALMGQTGVLVGLDYRNVEVVGAYTYVPALDVALVINVEAAEAEAASVRVALQLAGTSIAAVALGMAVLYVRTNRLLRSMDEVWDEGKRAIEKEKEAFGAVIRAMYPPLVAKLVLAGETHIVYDVPRVTVFFSDIYEFTTASNAITAEELIQFMGYTFGVMDAAAEHFHVHKVKTIGDAYLAVAGLPGTESPSGTICLDMLLFASSCAQLFSHRYLHPEDGNVLNTVHMALFGPQKQSAAGAEATPGPLRRLPSNIAYSNPALGGSGGAGDGEAPPAQCVMRYGVSNGPATAGVLPGKVPLFDVWGKTVNLASRMESTGQPGRIQISEGVHQSLLKVKGQPFTFDSRHKVYCKGFGHVVAYFLATSSAPPPEELLARLAIEPNLGQFHFDDGLPGLLAGQRAVQYTSSGQPSSVGEPSSHSSSVAK
eukprot:EG_transcript_688